MPPSGAGFGAGVDRVRRQERARTDAGSKIDEGPRSFGDASILLPASSTSATTNDPIDPGFEVSVAGFGEGEGGGAAGRGVRGPVPPP